MCFHSQDSIGGDPGDVRETSGLPRNIGGSWFIDFIRFLPIFIVFDYENTHDREKIAFTLIVWRRKRPQCESERDFFTIICVFIVKTPLGAIRETSGRRPVYLEILVARGLLILSDFYRFSSFFNVKT